MAMAEERRRTEACSSASAKATASSSSAAAAAAAARSAAAASRSAAAACSLSACSWLKKLPTLLPTRSKKPSSTTAGWLPPPTDGWPPTKAASLPGASLRHNVAIVAPAGCVPRASSGACAACAACAATPPSRGALVGGGAGGGVGARPASAPP
eukprot:scaffold89071_cov61-Phaeocystis_antarctica.AAC.2